MGERMMNRSANLTGREAEIAELIAWGAAKKEVASRFSLSERTVENHTRNIYGKTGCNKANELSAWWFCTRFHISFDLSPMKRTVCGLAFLVLILPQVFHADNDPMMIRPMARRECRTGARRKSDELEPEFF